MKITISSFSGGQGKTSLCVFLSMVLSSQGKKCLLLDMDPQASLTQFLGVEVRNTTPTTLEMLQAEFPANECISPTMFPNIFLIPADSGLENGQDYLTASGAAAIVLKRRIKGLSGYDYIFIDSPPQRANLSLTALGAADTVIIPAEANDKGINSCLKTLYSIDELKSLEMSNGNILGIVPFRDKWFGYSQETNCRRSIETLNNISASRNLLLFPSILESSVFPKCLNQHTSPSSLGQDKLLSPFIQIANALEPSYV